MINKDNTKQIMSIANRSLPRWFIKQHEDDVLSEGYLAMLETQIRNKNPEKSKLNTFAYKRISGRLKNLYAKEVKQHYVAEFEREVRRVSNNNTEIYSNISSYDIYSYILRLDKTKRYIVLDYIRYITKNLDKNKIVSILVNKHNTNKTKIYNTISEYKNLILNRVEDENVLATQEIKLR